MDYDFKGIFKLRFQDDLSKLLHGKLEHWRSRVESPDLTIRRGEGDQTIGIDPWSRYTHIRDGGGIHVALGEHLIADEMLAYPGKYQLVDKYSIYDIAPKLVTCSGKISDSFLEHEILRPVINSHVIQKGVFLAHAGGAAIDDNVLVFIGESGKTSMILELLSRGYDYMANESLFLGQGRECTTYSTWVGLEERHFEMYPELNDQIFNSPSARRRQGRRLSFHRMGASMTGDGLFQRTMRDYFMSRLQFSLLCPFKQLFPSARLRESGKVSHVFLLNQGKSDRTVSKSGPEEISKIATIASWITSGCSHNGLAELAGMPHHTKEDLNGVLLDGISGAECYKLDIGVRSIRNRDWLKEVANAVEAVVR